MREDYECLIEEWFSNCTTIEEIVITYADVFHELQIQMRNRVNELRKSV